MNYILELLKAHKFKVCGFLILSIATSLLGVGILAFINEYLLRDSRALYIIYFVLLLCLFLFCSLFVEIKLNNFGQNFIFQTQKKLVKQMLDTSFLQIDKITKAKLLASLNNDVRTISFGLMRFPEFTQSLILIIASSFYLIYLSPKIFLFCSVFIVFLFIIDYRLMMKNYLCYKKSRNSDDALQKDYENIIDGRKELALNTFRAKLYYDNEFTKNALGKRDANIKSGIYNSLSNNLNSIGFLALVGFEFYFSLHFGWASLAEATTIAIAILFLRSPLMSVTGSIPTLLMAKVSLDKIEHLDLTNYKQKFNLTRYEKPWSSIKFENVSFHYDEKFALSPTSLDIKRGELVFLIGKNGSGKSTFSMLFAGLIKPDSGAIYLDDMRLNAQNIALYRSLITAIFSDFHLFTQAIDGGSVASEDKIARWLEILGLFGKTQAQDGEITTTKLSTGQRKRLAMLIALLEERDILILDEFAADQDPIFRRFFYTKLLPLLKNEGKTILAISHDERYFDMADRIFLAQNGAISELKAAQGQSMQELAKDLVERFDEGGAKF